ncbi:MmgE/PrpD family protein [Azorhizobium doebereinerae]|uniref:MmgE/PrpD family protein n=1 Tax=Azorhizobium doebereinerae TaxID=281091 RepID=UPI0003F8CDE3|nr:MmgE/PrpD family protein [Azorhizobium doebereinerae]
MTTRTRRLADFAAGLTLADVPRALAEKLKLHLLDSIGCGLAGAGSDLARRALASVEAEHAPGPCPVLGTRVALAPAGAAFANAAAINALDHDDGFEVDGKGMGHPGATLVAAALSGAAMAGSDGATLLAALAAAYELNARVILSMQPSYARFRQVYGVCQHQALGAAAAYGRLVGLDGARMANALGFAGTLAPVPSLRKYNWEARPLVSFKDFNAPAAEAGVRAVQHDRAGLIGAVDVLDGDSGFWRMMGSDQFDPAVLGDGLGAVWWARHASFKPYPTCRWMHTALESFEQVHAARPLAAEAIEAIEVLTSAGLARDFMEVAPRTQVDAQFSLPFALASLALGRPKARWYANLSSTDADRAALAARVWVRMDPEIDAQMSGPARRPAGQVRVMAFGRWIEGPRLSYPLGCTERPMTPEAVIAKFRANAACAVPPATVARIEAAVLDLERQGDLSAVLGAA